VDDEEEEEEEEDDDNPPVVGRCFMSEPDSKSPLAAALAPMLLQCDPIGSLPKDVGSSSQVWVLFAVFIHLAIYCLRDQYAALREAMWSLLRGTKYPTSIAALYENL
jgi:hypothetical protein